jgi:hypothetical protein
VIIAVCKRVLQTGNVSSVRSQEREKVPAYFSLGMVALDSGSHTGREDHELQRHLLYAKDSLRFHAHGVQERVNRTCGGGSHSPAEPWASGMVRRFGGLFQRSVGYAAWLDVNEVGFFCLGVFWGAGAGIELSTKRSATEHHPQP